MAACRWLTHYGMSHPLWFGDAVFLPDAWMTKPPWRPKSPPVICRLLLATLCVGTATAAHGACGSTLQPMTVGVLPDIFLTPVGAGPGAGPIGGVGAGGPTNLFGRVEAKALFHYYTTNPALTPFSNCNVDLMSNLPGLLVSPTYGGDCPPTLPMQFAEPGFDPRRVSACRQRRYPPAVTVGPDIGDSGARRWPFQVSLLRAFFADRLRAKLELFGTNCPGDVCLKSICLRGGQSEFSTGAIPEDCLRFDPTNVNWAGGPEVGASYLMGRGNLYVGPKVQPAFVVRAARDTAALSIDHWISDGNPEAVVLISAIHSPRLPLTYWGSAFDRALGKWQIVPMDGRSTIPAGSTFHVYVMGAEGPGRRVPIRGGEGSRLRLNDPLLNGNPHAVLIVSPEALQVCGSGSAGGGGLSGGSQGSATGGSVQACRWEGFNHPLAVRYNSSARAWEVISENGADFRGRALHVFSAGLPGSFQKERWTGGIRPDYEARFDIFRVGDLAGVAGRDPSRPGGTRLPLSPFAARENDLVFFTRIAQPGRRSGAPADRSWNSPVALLPPITANGGWTLRCVSGGDLSHERFVMFSPVPAL